MTPDEAANLIRIWFPIASRVIPAAVAFIACALTACCPVSLRPEITHVSHISQHEGSDRTDYGYNAALLGLHLEPVKHLQIDVAEGMILNSRDTHVHGADCYGGMLGPREIFSATLAWDIQVRR